ncbi:galactose-1-phosphate uridylyltransferase [Candidatus Sumerlaeota bacterium]|nr:galactose-1-phosphate uridylyltransferase [Candidatus Sumerlaeota bacterium]
MSTLRFDPISGGWVIIAEDRALRPKDFDRSGLPVMGSGACPFCEGNESETPSEIRSIRREGSEPNGPGWELRVVPNTYAALRIEGNLDSSTDGIYHSLNGVGAHEVIIESPDHEGRLGDYPLSKVESILRVYRERISDLHRDPRFRYIQIFRNYGAGAGASLRHPHSQLIALPITPRWVEEELDHARDHFAKGGRCLFCDVLAQELMTGSRMVAENAAFAAFAPFASKLPYETWILPKIHNHDFQQATDAHLVGMADILQRVILSLQRALDDPPFNLILHSAPEVASGRGSIADLQKIYHWHMEIIPRITSVAGFELGTGFHINAISPEKAAARLREVLG